MGVIYYAANQETKKSYCLGKGGWENLITNDVIDTKDFNSLLEKITNDVIKNGGWSKEVEDNILYHKKIANDLMLLGESLILLNDDRDYELLNQYEVVGTRYINKL